MPNFIYTKANALALLYNEVRSFPRVTWRPQPLAFTSRLLRLLSRFPSGHSHAPPPPLQTNLPLLQASLPDLPVPLPQPVVPRTPLGYPQDSLPQVISVVRVQT